MPATEVRSSPSGPLVEAESAGGLALSNVLFVDLGTTAPLALQNGSAIAPFASIQAAIDLLAEVEGGTILIAPGNYETESLTSDFSLVLRSLGADGTGTVELGDFAAGTAISLALFDIDIIQAITGVDSMEATGVSFGTAFSVGALEAENCDFGATVTADTFIVNDCDFNDSVSLSAGGDLDAFNCTFEAITGGAGSQMTFRECTINDAIIGRTISINGGTCAAITQSVGTLTITGTRIGGLITSSAPTVRNSFIGDVFTSTDGLDIDRSTYYTALVSGVAFIVPGTLTLLDEVAASVAVVVPAVAADAVAYLDVSMAGTTLAGIPANTPIQVNPAQDLAAAGPGGGFMNARVSAAGSVRLAFKGALAGGATTMLFTRI